MRYFLPFLRLLAAGIMLQTLYFKFSGAPESIYIFAKIGIEPWGRYFTGSSELVACILLLVPATQVMGALMGLGLMTGAIASHFLFLGIDVQGDGGLLFILVSVTWLASGLILWFNRMEIRNLIEKVRKHGI